MPESPPLTTNRGSLDQWLPDKYDLPPNRSSGSARRSRRNDAAASGGDDRRRHPARAHWRGSHRRLDGVSGLPAASATSAPRRQPRQGRLENFLGVMAQADRIAQDCTRGVDYCDERTLRQAKRACSAFGPMGERRP